MIALRIYAWLHMLKIKGTEGAISIIKAAVEGFIGLTAIGNGEQKSPLTAKPYILVIMMT